MFFLLRNNVILYIIKNFTKAVRRLSFFVREVKEVEKVNKGGRPPKYKTPEELEQLIDGYFAKCEATGEPITLTGLCMAIGTTRDTLITYGKKDEFVDTIKKARNKVENSYELRLINRGNAGDIFALKQFGWSDRQDVNIGGQKDAPFEVNIKVVD